MLPQLSYNQKIFIEITNLKHGGKGWGLGTCLWSPVLDRGKSRAWKIMNEIKPGDIIIHLVDIKRSYHWFGLSFTNSNLIESEVGPAEAGNWANMNPYQRINLINFTSIPEPVNINLFFTRYDSKLKEILKHNSFGQFYNEYGVDGSLRMAQRYIAKCPEELYSIFDEYSNLIKFNPVIGSSQNVPTLNEPQNPDYHHPGRINSLVSRIVRDTSLSRKIKEENNWKCQICGESIILPNSKYYSEGHHLKPLGGEHSGPDIRDNIIILCPTHHTEFDYGSIAINPRTMRVEHIDRNNNFHGKNLAYTRNDLGQEFIEYHYEKQFNKE